MSQIEQVVAHIRRLETLLRQQYHAQGQGLHQLADSCEQRLPHDVLKQLRYIASIRNNLVRDPDYQIENLRDFLRKCQQCEKALTPRSARFIWSLAIGLMVLVTAGVALFYLWHWPELQHYLPN